MNIQITLLFIVATINSLLGLFVILGKKDKVNVVYSLFVVFASFWAIGLAFFISEMNPLKALYIANFYYVSALGIPIFFSHFSLIFLNKDFKPKKRHALIYFPLIVLIILFFLDKNFILEKVFFTDWGKDVIINRINYLFYSAIFISFVVFSYSNLFRSYLSKTELRERKQLRMILWGTSIGFLFGMIFDLIFPFIGNYRHIFIGPLFSLFMVISVTYAITKYRMFNIKVILAELLVFILWIFIFIRTFFSVDLQDFAINGGISLIMIVVGILLIRSVMKEVNQREKLEILTGQLEDANDNLENLIKQRESLVHLITHKVKSSFTRTKVLFASMLDGTFGEVSPEIKKRAEQGLEFDNAGIRTVDLVLNVANMQNGLIKYDMKNIDFKELVEQSISEKRIPAETKGLKLETELGDGVYNVLGDSIWLKEAVNNLIDNSIHYTKEGKIIVGLENNNGKIKLSIKDTGMGITEEDKKNLFTEGGRGKDSVKINVDSTGYGLFTVKLIVEAHKGKVWVKSEGENKGSQFYVELPATL